jgi:predicted DNA-binding transcriptional regulator YafY
MNRIDRLLAILLQISNGRLFKAKELAENFELSERTVYRDISALVCWYRIPFQPSGLFL